MADSSRSGPAWMLFLAATMLISLITGWLFVPHLKQWQAKSFVPAPGRILKTTKLHNARGRTVEWLDLHYEYFVNGQRYENTTLRFDTFPEMPTWVSPIKKRYPVGSDVAVFHRPGVPSDSVLETGVDWGKLQVELLFWLCLPGFAIGFIAALMDAGVQPPVFLRPVTTAGSVTVHTQSKWIPLAMSGMGLSVLAVGGGFVVGLTANSASWLAIPAWLAVLVAPFQLHRAFRECWEQGIYDLTIDFGKGTLTLPGGMLTPQKTLRLSDLQQIIVRPPNPKSRKGLQRVIVTRYEYPLHGIGGGEAGKAFDGWLAGQLGIPVILDDSDGPKPISHS